MPSCAVPECRESPTFGFPSDPALNLQWRGAIQRLDHDKKTLWKPTSSSRLCATHFKPEDFKTPFDSIAHITGKTRRMLKEGAVPSIFQTAAEQKQQRQQQRDNVSVQYSGDSVKMPASCVVPKCGDNGTFGFPTDPKLSLQWRVAIKRLDRDKKTLWKPTPHSRVCANHFKREDFKVPFDSVAHITGKTRRMLRECAVPSIFPLDDFWLHKARFGPGQILIEGKGLDDNDKKVDFLGKEVLFVNVVDEELNVKMDIDEGTKNDIQPAPLTEANVPSCDTTTGDGLDEPPNDDGIKQEIDGIGEDVVDMDKEANVGMEELGTMNAIRPAPQTEAHITLKRDFKCDQCEYAASSKGNLTHHIKSVHKKERHFKCDQCDYAASVMCNLTHHIQSVHGKKRDFKCHLCDYAASVKCNLTSHIRSVHEKKRDFKCNQCDYAATVKCNLTSHIKSVHEKKRDFKCGKCDYATSMKCNLTQHMKIVH